MKTIIVEDERNNADLLRHFLTKYCPNVELIDTCYTKEEAVHTINQKNPELLFLDIILEEETAFDLLEEIDHSQTHIIFITAFDQYALKAFQYHAVDYLLKPLQIDDLINAVNQVLNRDGKKELNTPHLRDMLLSSATDKSSYVTVANIDKVNFIKNDSIIYCKSSGRYTEFYLNDDRRIVASKSLGEFEQLLNPNTFFRVHKSYIINLDYLMNINKKAGNYCELNNGISIPISRRRIDNLIQFINKM